MSQSYWERIIGRQVKRRLVIIGGAGLGLSAALLAACGDGNGSSGTKGTPVDEGRISVPKDTVAQVKRGGVYQQSIDADETNLDPLSTGRGNGGAWAPLAYSRPLAEKVASGGTSLPSYVGDLAESFEIAPDGLSLTMKLRPNAVWDSRDPTNGRAVDTEDVLYSWNRFESSSPFGAKLSYKVSKGAAPVQSVQAIDKSTYVYKLAFPWSPLLPSLSSAVGWIIPKEAEGKFDPRNTIRGSGPWMLQKYEPSVGFTWARNPNWHGKSVYGFEAPYLDGVYQSILPEYSTYLSQFRNGSIWDGKRVRGEDVPEIAQNYPGVNIYRGDFSNGVPNIIFMTEPNSPWLDVRRRRAVSMAIDRVTLANAASGADLLEKSGLNVKPVINGFLGAGWGGYALDPQSKEIGEGAANFAYNVAEAKKQMSAAGTPDLNITMAFTTQYIDEKWASTIADMLNDGGIHSKLRVVDYNNVMLAPNGGILYSKGQFSQWGDLSFSGGGADADPAATLFKIWDTNGSTSRANLTDGPGLEINSLIEKATQTFDQQQYLSLVQEAQRKLAVHLPSMPYFYDVQSFVPVHPWVMNWNVMRNSQTNTGLLNVWFDQAKKS